MPASFVYESAVGHVCVCVCVPAFAAAKRGYMATLLSFTGMETWCQTWQQIKGGGWNS